MNELNEPGFGLRPALPGASDRLKTEQGRRIGKLHPGGTLFLDLPHPECGVREPGSPMVGDEQHWQPKPEKMREALAALGCTATGFDDGPDAMMSFHVHARRTG